MSTVSSGGLQDDTAPVADTPSYPGTESAHYLSAIRRRLEQLYDASADNPRLREQLSDEVDWIDKEIELVGDKRRSASVDSAALAQSLEPPSTGGVAQAPMRADIAQMIDAGWKTGKSSSEVAEEILREFDASTVSSTDGSGARE